MPKYYFFRCSLRSRHWLILQYYFQFNKKDQSNVRCLALQTDTQYRELPRGTLLVCKHNLGPKMPLPLTPSSNTNTSNLLLQLYTSECCIFIRTKNAVESYVSE